MQKKNEVLKNTQNTIRLKFANGQDVAVDATIRTEKKGNKDQYFVVNSDSSETQVYSAATFSKRRLKFADWQDVGVDATIRTEKKGNKAQYFVVNSDGSETQVYTAG